MDNIVFTVEEFMEELKKTNKKRMIALIESEDDVERKRREFNEYIRSEQILLKIMMDKMIKRRENIIFSTIAPARIGMSFIGMGISERFGLNFQLDDYYKLKEKYLKERGLILDEKLPRKSRR